MPERDRAEAMREACQAAIHGVFSGWLKRNAWTTDVAVLVASINDAIRALPPPSAPDRAELEQARASLDTERECRESADRYIQTLREYAEGKGDGYPIGGFAKVVRDHIERLRTAVVEREGALREAVDALSELVEVAGLRGDSDLPHPCDDPLLWTARMQEAWDAAAAIAAQHAPRETREGGSDGD